MATNPDGKWELIDGLQRVSTVLSFFNELKDEEGNPYPKNGLKLVEGSMLKGLKNITIETLPLEYKLQIKRTPCRVEIILKESEFKMRYELFKRLNTGGEGLSRQEIRNCIFRGLDSRYSEFVAELAQNETFREIVTISVSNEEKMYYEELVLRYLTLKNKGTRYSQANIQDYMDDYLESQCKEFDDSQIEKDKNLFINIMKILEKLKDENIFKLGKRYFTTSMYDAIMLSLSENMINLEDVDIEQLGKKIAILKEDDNFNKYVGSAISNPTSITNKVKIARKVLLDITE